MRILVLSILFLCISILSVWADDKEKETTYTETIVVTADRIEEPLKDVGSSVTVISHEEIERRQSPFVLDLLRTVPGLYISQSGSVGKITSLFTRGAGSDQTLVMIDGVQINDSTGFVDLASLSTTNIERIEVVRGPQSTLYGSDAMGGVVNIITANGGPLLSARGEFGSDSTFRGGVRSGYGSDKNNVALEYDRYTTDGETTNDDYDNKTVAASAHIQVTDWTNLGLIYRNTDTDLGIPYLQRIPSPDQRQKNGSTLVHVPFKQRINDWWDAQAHFSVFDQDLHYRHPSDPGGFTSTDTDSRTTTFNLLHTLRIANHQTFIGGYEYEKFRVDDRSSFGVNLDNAEVHNNAVYGQYQMSVWSPLTVTFGLRVDDNNKFGSDTNPRLAVSYQPVALVRLHGTVGTGFRAPRPLELSSPYGNPNLRPEEVTGWDLGADYDVVPNSISVSGTVFHNKFDQLIGFDFEILDCPPGSFFGCFANFEKVKTSGLELLVAVRPTPNLNVRANYTYLQTEGKIAGKDPLRRPKNSGGINIDYRRQKLGLNFNWNMVGKRFDLHDLTFDQTVNDGFNKADTVVSYDLTKDFQVYARITNAFDKKYQEVFGFPSPNRGVFFGVRFGLANH